MKQRTGPKANHDQHCPAGHVVVSVLIVGRGMRDACRCTGYQSIPTDVPYKSLQAKIKTGGKARIWFETLR